MGYAHFKLLFSFFVIINVCARHLVMIQAETSTPAPFSTCIPAPPQPESTNPLDLTATRFGSGGQITDVVRNSMDSTQSHRCECWNTTIHGSDESELECQCEGLLSRIPQQLNLGVQRLFIESASLPRLRRMGLKIYKFIQDITLSDLAEFSTIEAGAFESLNHLRTIYITNAPNLHFLPANVFFGVSSTLKFVKILNCGLVKVPDFRYFPKDTLLTTVDLEGNRIKIIDSNSITLKTDQLILDNNELTYIDSYAFNGSWIAELSLKGNSKLTKINDLAFSGSTNIQKLDLSGTSLVGAPYKGLDQLEILRIQDTHSLKTIPSVYNFKSLREAYLTHPFHCCAFKFPARHDPQNHATRQQILKTLQAHCSSLGGPELTRKPEYVGPYQSQQGDILGINRIKREVANSSGSSTNNNFGEEQFGDPIDITDGFGKFHDPFNVTPYTFDAICGNITEESFDVKCFPLPDELNPCEDVMGLQWLRISVWVVVGLAVFGNVFVLVVLLTNRTDMSVSRFLICNLAFADLCMGLYLLLLASIDLHSINEYFNFAFDWQYGAGCKSAGFLTVFATHLSVFTLTIITLDRWFAITYAIYLNKRLKLKTAAYIMLGGWSYSILMGSLPLFGISNYSSTSICLPMEARDWLDRTYLFSVLGSNGLAFIVIVICYVRIYYSLGKETRQAEMAVAKKMALLVFTNFVCWAPIAFFGITALTGLPLIDVAKSKILLVFFYPLNSCANPYLYAILTSQYRRDLFLLLSKLGVCKRRAQKYKLSYSLPTTNNTIPLIGRPDQDGHQSSLKKPNCAPEDTSTMVNRKSISEAYL